MTLWLSCYLLTIIVNVILHTGGSMHGPCTTAIRPISLTKFRILFLCFLFLVQCIWPKDGMSTVSIEFTVAEYLLHSGSTIMLWSSVIFLERPTRKILDCLCSGIFFQWSWCHYLNSVLISYIVISSAISQARLVLPNGRPPGSPLC